jgi:uncharacterized protein (TIGR02001 family)
MKTKNAAALALMLTGMTGAAYAESPISANVALTTDYVWRGVSQTDNGPAIQGGFDYAHESGVYVGVWGSNVDFGPAVDSNVEVDLYGGYATEFDGGVSLDVGFIHYDYPSESDNDFEELYLGLGYGPVSARVSHDFDNENTYWELGAGFDLPAEVGLSLHVGYYDFDDGSEYSDWKVAVSKSLAGADFELAYTDTDIDDDDLADGRLFLSVSKSF